MRITWILLIAVLLSGCFFGKKNAAKQAATGKKSISKILKNPDPAYKLRPFSSFTPRLAEVLKVSSIWLADGRGPKNGPDSQSEDEIVRERSARETARGLRLAVMAIADKYNVNPCDLVDPSDEALDGIEWAIIAARSLSPHPE